MTEIIAPPGISQTYRIETASDIEVAESLYNEGKLTDYLYNKVVTNYENGVTTIMKPQSYSGGGGSSGGGGDGGSNEPSRSPDVRINSFGLSPGFPDQQPPLPAGSNISFEIELENRGTKDKFQQNFTVTALGETLTSASLTSPTNTPTLRNIRVPIPQVDSERPVEFCAKLSDKNETECVTYRVTPDFDPDAVEVTQIEVPSQIRVGDDLSGTIRVDNPNPKTAQVRWRVDFGGGTVTDDGVTRVPGEKVVEIPYSGRAPETDGQFEVCGRLDSVTPQ